MNRQRYRLVFSQNVGGLVPAAENTRGRGKAASGAGRARGATIVLGAVLLAAPALAQVPVPQGSNAGYSVIGNRAFVNQVGNKAIHNWASFNLGAGNTVQFGQVNNLTSNQFVPGASFTSLNRIWDINPSVIAGSITQAPGQKANVIMVNSNGIAFMGGAQVNLASFTASTLNMADEFVLDRLVGGDPSRPQFSGAQGGGAARGFIKVFEGANITADSQGRVMLIAPTVVNRGTVQAPDGQVILAAGTRAYLRTDDTVNSLDLRGLLVEVDNEGLANLDFNAVNTSVVDSALDGVPVSLRSAAEDKLGHATNVGTLSSARGNVTMVGYAVNQNGIARATSSVISNGSVYLMAKDTVVPPATQGAVAFSRRLGQVTLGANSLTEVLPEVNDVATSVDANTGTGQAAPSQVLALGRQIYMAEKSTIRVPSGEVRFTATESRPANLGGNLTAEAGSDPLSADRSSIHVAAGATIDVAGLRGIQVAAARNTVEVELRGDELKDSPINQTGPLRGEKAWVDVQQALDNAEAGVDTLIAKDSLQAYAQRLERNVAERSTAGGAVVLDSQGSVIVENGATLNLSGGSIDYLQGTAKTTVLSSRGVLTDLADAQATTRYDAIVSRYKVDYDRWNQSETIELPNSVRVVQGYTDGQDAGSLSVFARSDVYLRPDVQGSTVAGVRQLASGNLPRGAQVSIGANGAGEGAPVGDPLARNVVIDRSAVTLPAGFGRGDALPAALSGTVTIDASLLAEGRVAELSVLTSQAAEVRSALRTGAGGKVDIAAQNIQINADIVTPGGSILLKASNLNPNDTSSNRVGIADGVTLSVAGTWVNRLSGVSGASAAPVLDGGTINIGATSEVNNGQYVGEGSIALGEGVRLDADGGALLTEQGQLRDGAGGSIVLSALKLQGLENTNLSAFGLNEGGSLSVTTQNITIGGVPPAVPVAGDLHLAAETLTQGGFADYNLKALENLEVVDQTAVRPVVAHRNLNADFRAQATGASMASISATGVRDPLQREGASLSLTALENATDTGDLRIGQGASIEVDPGASISLTGRKRLAIEGTLVARGGAVSASLERRPDQDFDNLATQGNLFLGDNAVIDVSGVALTEVDDQGLTQGKVLSGGSVSLLAKAGALITRADSRIDASGAAPVTLGERNESGGLGRSVASDAGSISLRGDNLFLDGALRAQAGSTGQRGGSLEMGTAAVGSSPTDASVSLLSNNVTNVVLNNRLAPQAQGLTAASEITGSSLQVATDPLEQAGFDRLRFTSSDGIALADGLELGSPQLRELQLDAARIETRGDAQLSADAVRLGNYFEGIRVGSAGDTTNHGGTLSATGRLLELAGNLRLQGTQRNALTGTELLQISGVTNRDIVASGRETTFTGPFRHAARIESSADLVLRGGVVAPGGFTDARVRAAGRDVTIESSGATPVVPLSALGRLSIEAQNITQGGHVVAPFGQISLDAVGNLNLEPGSVTSVAGTPGQVLPVGQLLNGIEWQVNLKPGDLVNGQTTLDDMPGKELRLNGAQVALKSGATVNLSGGGDLQAYEFTAGPGGSRDILTDANTYAIIPGYQSGFAPDDAQERTGLPVGEAVYLRGVQGLADGRHVLLPAHYALLPGALLVRLEGDAAPTAGQSQTRQDGVQVVAGYRTDSRTGAPRGGDWQGVQVLTQEQVRARSEFSVARASNFFAETGGVPQDAGLLSMTTLGELRLDATVLGAAAAGGRGLAVDVSAANLLVAQGDTPGVPAGTTLLDVDKLSALNASSLLLGATRATQDGTTLLTVGASSVTLQNDAQHALEASEVMLAARDAVTLVAGSVIDAQGADGDAGAYTTVGDGAFVRAASTSASFNRTGAIARGTGVLTGASDALIQAAKSINIDATANNNYTGLTEFLKNDRAVAGELTLGANRISFGEPVLTPEGILLDPTDLAALQGLDSLSLSSYTSFDFYGGVAVGGLGADGRPLLGKLTLNGASLTGLDNPGQMASLRARELTLLNTATAAATPPPVQPALAESALNIVAEKLVLGTGSKTVSGFSSVDIAAREIVGDGVGSTTVGGPTNIQTDRLTGNTSSVQTLDAGTNALAMGRLNSGTPLTDSTALGASWTLSAGSVRMDTLAELHSGAVTLQATGPASATTGNVVLGENAAIDVSGRDVSFFNVARGTQGGQVNLSSNNGAVTVEGNAATPAQAVVKLAGAAGADGGTLTVKAVNGEADLGALRLEGTAVAGADGQRGDGARVRIDANTLPEDANGLRSLSALGRALKDGGVDGEITVRTRSGNLNVVAGDEIEAHQVSLTADGGTLTVAGRVSASGEAGGRVALNGRSVTLADGARVEARSTAAGAEGGRVEIGAATVVDETLAGRIDLVSGSVIDVSGGTNGRGGQVHLRAQRQGGGAVRANDNKVAVEALDSTITGARETTLEAVSVYAGKTTLDTSTTNAGATLGLEAIKADNTSFATRHATIKTDLSGRAQDNNFHLVSGVEVRSPGPLPDGTLPDMTLTGADWNLGTATADGEAGVLSLRTQGNLVLNGSLSDAFVTTTPAYDVNPTVNPFLPDTLRGGRTWAYNLVAGADVTSADVMATRANGNGGNLTLAAGKLVRTGTGHIRVAAAGDVTLASNTSAIYTAGRSSAAFEATPETRLENYQDPSFQSRSPSSLLFPRAYFTQGGGDIQIAAGGNVVGARSTQLYSQWLWRTGRVTDDGASYVVVPPANNAQLNQGQTAWWVRFDQFSQGVATLGGGDVTVIAGGDVSNLSVSAPTQGRMNSAVPDASLLVKTGGGDVRVEAGRDVLGGQFFADEGNVNLRAGRDVGAGQSGVYPVLAIGDGQVRVGAHDNLSINAIINPQLVHQTSGTTTQIANIQGTSTEIRKAVFSTYEADTGVSLQSLTGDVASHTMGWSTAGYDTFFSDTSTVNLGNNRTVSVESPLSLLPPRVAMTAFDGSVRFVGDNASQTLLPSTQGQLELLAKDSVDFGSRNLVISDRDPATIPSAARPVGYQSAGASVLDPAFSIDDSSNYASVPVHSPERANDGRTTAKVYAVEGDTVMLGSGYLRSSKAVEVRAGGDVIGLNLTVQHASTGDRSVVQAGRDVVYPNAGFGIRVGGPGLLEVSAGRDVNLGLSQGILSRGDLDNNNLPLGGASLQIMAGVGPVGLDAAAALQRLADRVSSGSVSDTDLWLVRWLVGDNSLSASAAASAVQGVQAQSEQTQRDQVRDMLFTALRATGRAANVANSGYAGTFDRGYAALELAFPGISDMDANGRFTAYEGEINLFASRINTARGGDISFLVPGGGMVVGLANTPAALTAPPPVGGVLPPGPLGVVASSTGDIRGFTRDDMLVNQSRILTVGGGDILLWSSEGDLDAGKGKKTASTVPPPIIRVDSQGNVVQELQGAATGSGIGALTTGDTTAGDVDLIAPKGTVNAGDAGIRAGNLNIAALVVLGADNISVSGSSAGTPVADTSAVSAASSGATSGGDDTGKVVEALNQAAADSAKAAQELASALRPSVVRVDVLGFGDGP